jgi:hypothetical protein
MKTPRTREYLFATLFVAISLLSLMPILAHADQQPQTERMTFNLTGEATPIGNGLSGTSTLNLTALTYKNADQWLIIQNVTGSLQINSTSFPVTGGQGSVNKLGEIAIFADTNSRTNQLILHGTMNGSSLTFTSPQSQLASISYLSLSGTATQGTGQTINLGTTSASTNENATSTRSLNVTQQGNITSTSALEFQNTTSFQNGNATTTTQGNATNSITLNNATSSGIPAAVSTGTSNTTLTHANVTVTTTQYLNQTISVTQTVANVTVNYTVTSTIANTTTTQANVTTTVNATTTTGA